MMNLKKYLFITGIMAMVIGQIGAVSPQQAIAQETTCRETYTIQANDWLSKIADKFLGDIEAYTVITIATNEVAREDDSFTRILNPNRIEVGWKVCIPGKPKAEAIFTETIEESETPNQGQPELLDEDLVIAPDIPYSLDDFVAEFNFSSKVKSEWIYESPEKIVKGDITSEIQTIHDTFGYRANYLWNPHLADDYFFNTRIFETPLEEVKLFDAPWGTIFPRYRYPPNATLPTGLHTNQFGWRGPEITFDKPRNTIRIACVGASTTVNGPTLPYSYPQLLEHWLNLWAEENDYDVDFEVINAGREGIGAKDIAAVVRYEILPMDIDYVIYYEGSNQFTIDPLVDYPPEYTFGQPPAGLVPNLDNVDSDDKTLLDQLSEYSALAARARNIVEQFSVTGMEPPKPEQSLILPEGFDEFNPQRDKLGNMLALRKILDDLDQIKQDLDEQEVKFMLGTFEWFVYDGMVLDPTRQRNLYAYINRVYWPVSYENMQRLADIQNRVFHMWADTNDVPLIEIAEQMPRQPDLFDDAIHNRPLGVRIRAWLNFEAIVPLLEKDIESDRLPRTDKIYTRDHPYISAEYETETLIAQ